MVLAQELLQPLKVQQLGLLAPEQRQRQLWGVVHQQQQQQQQWWQQQRQYVRKACRAPMLYHLDWMGTRQGLWRTQNHSSSSSSSSRRCCSRM
jgi:protein involved in ribonucleotide reduction